MTALSSGGAKRVASLSIPMPPHELQKPVRQSISDAEQWIKEGKQAVKMARLSCHRFRSNEVRLWLSVIAYNLGNLWRRLVLPKRNDNWSCRAKGWRLGLY